MWNEISISGVAGWGLRHTQSDTFLNKTLRVGYSILELLRKVYSTWDPWRYPSQSLTDLQVDTNNSTHRGNWELFTIRELWWHRFAVRPITLTTRRCCALSETCAQDNCNTLVFPRKIENVFKWLTWSNRPAKTVALILQSHITPLLASLNSPVAAWRRFRRSLWEERLWPSGLFRWGHSGSVAGQKATLQTAFPLLHWAARRLRTKVTAGRFSLMALLWEIYGARDSGQLEKGKYHKKCQERRTTADGFMIASEELFVKWSIWFKSHWLCCDGMV